MKFQSFTFALVSVFAVNAQFGGFGGGFNGGFGGGGRPMGGMGGQQQQGGDCSGMGVSWGPGIGPPPPGCERGGMGGPMGGGGTGGAMGWPGANGRPNGPAGGNGGTGVCDSNYNGFSTMMTNRVSITQQGSELVVSSNNVPDHPFYTDNARNPICEQDVNMRLPATPQYSQEVTAIPTRGAIGIALNGVYIFGPQEGNSANAVEDTFFVPCEGHPTPFGQWHYHHPDIACMRAGPNTLVGYALDGFPIYGALSGTKQQVDQVLDQCNGVFENGSYRYHIRSLEQVDHTLPYSTDGVTNNWNYVLGCYHGVPISSARQGGIGGATPAFGRGPEAGNMGPQAGGPGGRDGFLGRGGPGGFGGPSGIQQQNFGGSSFGGFGSQQQRPPQSQGMSSFPAGSFGSVQQNFESPFGAFGPRQQGPPQNFGPFQNMGSAPMTNVQNFESSFGTFGPQPQWQRPQFNGAATFRASSPLLALPAPSSASSTQTAFSSVGSRPAFTSFESSSFQPSLLGGSSYQSFPTSSSLSIFSNWL